jgi:hypothetical protein
LLRSVLVLLLQQCSCNGNPVAGLLLLLLLMMMMLFSCCRIVLLLLQLLLPVFASVCCNELLRPLGCC